MATCSHGTHILPCSSSPIVLHPCHPSPPYGKILPLDVWTGPQHQWLWWLCLFSSFLSMALPPLLWCLRTRVFLCSPHSASTCSTIHPLTALCIPYPSKPILCFKVSRKWWADLSFFPFLFLSHCYQTGVRKDVGKEIKEVLPTQGTVFSPANCTSSRSIPSSDDSPQHLQISEHCLIYFP